MEDYRNQEFYNPVGPIQKSNKKIWLWVLISVIILITGVMVVYFINSSSKTISDNEFSQGVYLH